jgi:hypothetical protein
MEVGRMAQIEQSQIKNEIEVKKVQETFDSNEIKFNDEHQKSRKVGLEEYDEVILDNVRFGYNKQSKDFFIKIKRGDQELKFPTEAMMKQKAQLMEIMKESGTRL